MQPPYLLSDNADFPQELSRRNHPSRHHPRGLTRCTGLHQEGRIRDPVLHSPAAFLASSGSTASLCNSLWAENNDTHDPDVSAAETLFDRNIREDAAWRHALRGTCCATHTRTGHFDGVSHPRRSQEPVWSPLSEGDADLTRTALQQLLCVSFLDHETQCEAKSSIVSEATPQSARGRETLIAHAMRSPSEVGRPS